MSEEFEWYVGSPEELERYKGKYVAIVSKEVVGSGKTADEAYREALKKYPDSRPLLVFIPEDEAMIL